MVVETAYPDGRSGQTAELVHALLAGTGPASALVTDPDLTAAHRGDETAFLDSPLSLAIVLPCSTPEVAAFHWRNVGLGPVTAAMLLAQDEHRHRRGTWSGRDWPPGRRVLRPIRSGASFASVTVDSDESHILVESRQLASPALERFGTAFSKDVAFSCPSVIDLYWEVHRIALYTGPTTGILDHAGDGKMHPPTADAAASRKGRRLVRGGRSPNTRFRQYCKRTARRCTTAAWLIGGGGGATGRALPHRLMATQDPHGILDPGKVL